MSLTLKNLTGFQRGIESDETGINCSSFRLEIKPEIKDKLTGIDGQVRGFAYGDPEGTLTIEGEISGSTGVMAAVFGTAFVPANDTTYFGRTTGGFYLDSASIEQTRDGWKSVSASFSSNTGVA